MTCHKLRPQGELRYEPSTRHARHAPLAKRQRQFDSQMIEQA